MLRVKRMGRKYYVHGTVVRPDGERVRVRKALGLGVGDEDYLEAAKARVMRDAMRATGGETVEDLVRAYMGRPDAPGSGSLWFVKDFEKKFGGLRLDALDARAIEAHAWGDGSCCEGTVARKLTAVKAMLRWGMRRGLPVKAEVLERIERPSVHDAREVYLEREEQDRLFGEMEEDLRDLCLFLVNTGMRLGEATRLAWGDIDPRDGSALTWTKKGQGRRVRKRRVPLNSTAWAALSRQQLRREAYEDGPIFRDERGRPWGRASLYPKWAKACEASGVEGVRFHDLRHTFASRLVQQGVELHVVGKLLGHSSLQTTTRYSHLAPSQMRDVVAALVEGGHERSEVEGM